jgi:hypothetical protein
MKIQASTYGISDRLTELIGNLQEMEQAKKEGTNEVNLTKASFITPISVLPLAVYAVQNKIKINCLEENNDICSYLDTIGFPNGVTALPKTVKGYLPITKLACVEEDKILGEYEDNILAQAQAIQEIQGLKNALKYLTSELVNNVNEHAGVKHYWLLAQYYERPQKKCEIVIGDCGRGYKKSYEDTEFAVKTDREAIENALEGRSSKSARKKSSARGKGIPSIVNIFVNGYGGKIAIASGNSMIYYKPEEEKKKLELKSYWQGALVAINFNLKPLNYINYVDV